MPYAIADIEVTQPLPTLSLCESDTGIALILRRKNKPIGFLMQALPGKSLITSEELSHWIVQKLGSKLLQESLREELVCPANQHPFPSLTVAICTKDRTDNLSRCLESLLKLQMVNKPLGSPNYEILVVDNAPTDEQTQ